MSYLTPSNSRSPYLKSPYLKSLTNGHSNGHCTKEERQAYFDTEGARCLGWTSIAIGLTELAAPKTVQDLLGIEDRPDHRGILRVLGVRELLHGVSLLTEKAPTPQMNTGVWSRVAGDVLDTALLGVAATKTKRPGSFAMVAAAVGAIGLLDMCFASRIQRYQTH